MRLPRFRLNVGCLMALVFLTALGFRLAVPAVQVLSLPPPNCAHYIDTPMPGRTSQIDHTVVAHPVPFWPRDWHQLLGRRWSGDHDCPQPGYYVCHWGDKVTTGETR